MTAVEAGHDPPLDLSPLGRDDGEIWVGRLLVTTQILYSTPREDVTSEPDLLH